MTHFALSGPTPRGVTYRPAVTTHRNVNKEPAAIVKALLDKMTALRKQRDLTLKKMMKLAGSTQQAWDRWRKGSAPRLDSLEAVARALDADLVVDLRDRRSQPAPQRLPVGFSAESIGIATAIDGLPEEARHKILDMVVKIAGVLHTAPHPAQATGVHPGKTKK